MKCINCGIDNNLKERTYNQGRCKQCGHQIVFDPKMKPAFSDLFFKNAIASLSTDNNYFFTQKQFAYFLENKISQKNAPKNGFSVANFLIVFIVMNFIFIVLINEFFRFFGDIDFEKITIILFCIYWLLWVRVSWIRSNSEEQLPKTRKKYAKVVKILGIFAIVLAIYCFFRIGFIISLIIAGIGSWVIYMGSQNLQNQDSISTVFPLQSRDLNLWLDRWSQVNGKLEHLLPPPTEKNAAISVSPEIGSYSFDRVVVCDRAEIAQFLIANNFHFDYYCAILSITGYPQTIFSSVLEMLKRNPNLTVYTLHDASPRGIGLTYSVKKNPQWFGDREIAVYDVGLRPSHVLRNQNLFIRNSDKSKQQAKQIPTAIRQTLSVQELTWLEQGNFVELELFPPRKLLKILAQMVNSNSTQWQNEDSLANDSADSFYGNDSTDVSVYSADTFG